MLNNRGEKKKTHTHIKRKINELTKKKQQCRRKRKQKIMKTMENKNNDYKKDAA